MRVITNHVRPPIGTTQFDWTATFAGYEPGDLIGRGQTEAEAIEDLYEQFNEEKELAYD